MGMSGELIIRPAIPGDLESLLDLYKHLNPGDTMLDLSSARQIFDQYCGYTGSVILLGFRGGIIATSCTLIVVPNLTRGGAPYGLIENVITEPRYRNCGYGKAILSQAITVAWSHQCYKVMLLTGSKNPATIKFYGDVGFEQTKTGFQVRQIPPRKE